MVSQKLETFETNGKTSHSIGSDKNWQEKISHNLHSFSTNNIF